MKKFNENLESLKKELSDTIAVKEMIEALPYKINEPVIYNNRPAIVYGFQTIYDKLNNKILQVLLVASTDEASDRYGMIHKIMEIKANVNEVAPYTDAAKMLFNKG